MTLVLNTLYNTIYEVFFFSSKKGEGYDLLVGDVTTKFLETSFKDSNRGW